VCVCVCVRACMCLCNVHTCDAPSMIVLCIASCFISVVADSCCSLEFFFHLDISKPLADGTLSKRQGHVVHNGRCRMLIINLRGNYFKMVRDFES